MDFKTLVFLVKSDLYRHTGKVNFSLFIKELFCEKSFIICFWYRICHFLYKNNNKFLLGVFKLIFSHYKTRFSIDIYTETEIGSGLYLGHVYGIIINPKAKIGKNVNISQGVTIGQANRGKKKGFPVIGDNVFIGPGVCILGNINIGNNVAVGANAVVTDDLPDNAVAVGIPAKIISYDGAEGMIYRTDYEQDRL